MQRGYTSEWMPLLDALRHVQRHRGGTPIGAWHELEISLREGAVKGRYPGADLSYAGLGDGLVPSSMWYRAHVDLADGRVFWDRQPPAFLVEICRGDVLRWWPEGGSDGAQEEDVARGNPLPGGRRGGSREAPFWPKAREVVRKWLEDEGCPGPWDRKQAQLERRIADWLANHGHEAGEATIRRHVAQWIGERRQELGS